MNEERVKRLRNEIAHLRRELAKEIGVSRGDNLDRSVERAATKLKAQAAGYKSVKAWQWALAQKAKKQGVKA